MGVKQKKFEKTKAGFTVIELVLVLAIAALVFTMALIVLPALQRAQRDTQRRRDVGLVGAQVLQWKTNNPRTKFSTLTEEGSGATVGKFVGPNHPLASYLKYDTSQPGAPYQLLSPNIKSITVANRVTDNLTVRVHTIFFDVNNLDRFSTIYIMNGYSCEGRQTNTQRIRTGADAEGNDIYRTDQTASFPTQDDTKFFVAVLLESGDLYCQDFN